MVRNVVVSGLVAAIVLAATAGGRGAAFGATQRRVSGIITAVEAQSVSIQPPGKKAVSARIDAARTRVTIDGHAAKPPDLKVTYDAKAELGLDDVWISVRADSQ